MKATPKSPSVVFPPPWTSETPKASPDFGPILSLLEGTWKTHNPKKDRCHYGVHTTCMPAPGSNSEQIPGKFHFISDLYYETLEFKKIPDSVRNRGGANEQFCGVLEYHQQINRVSDDGLIHVENGMYLNMKPVYLRTATADDISRDIGYPEMGVGAGATGPVFVPDMTICRSGTIPHGTTINLIGGPALEDDGLTVKKFKGKPEWPTGDATWPKNLADRIHLAISATMGGGGHPFNLDEPAPKDIVDEEILVTDPSSNVAYTQRIVRHANYPYSVRPDLILRDAIAHQHITSYYSVTLDAYPIADPTQGTGGPHGGIISIPFVNRFTPVKSCKFNFWIETGVEDGKEFLQLQYEQILTFEFGFGTNGGATIWPHIQTNTLRKQPAK